MKARILFVSAVLSFCLCVLVAHAGTTFTYQGRLNEAGAPVNGVYQMTFRLFNAASGLQQLGGFTFFGVVVSNGLFDVTLDYGAEVFDGSPLWLEIGVRTNGSTATFTTLAPRQPITSAPYAITAEKVTGPISDSQLSANIPRLNAPATFTAAITAPAFAGNGSALSNVDAATLGGFAAQDFWKLNGNSGAIPGTHFLGTVDNQPLELKVDGMRAFRLIPTPLGLPNVIGGSAGNDVIGASGVTIGGGNGNSVLASSFTVVGGGSGNVVHPDSQFSTIAGGVSNLAYGTAVTIAGGQRNKSSSSGGAIGGGQDNFIHAYSDYCTIGGGSQNFISFQGGHSTIGGGQLNTIDKHALSSTIAGGANNFVGSRTTSGPQGATIGGGDGNTNFSHYAAIAGGTKNTIENGSDSAVIAGGAENTILQSSRNTAIAGGMANSITQNEYSIIGGGRQNQVSGDSPGRGHNVIGGGGANRISESAIFSSIGGGASNVVTGNLFGGKYCTIAGGAQNTINGGSRRGTLNTISGGYSNTISEGSASTIAGGEGNLIDSVCEWGVIGGGYRNVNGSRAGTISGGYLNKLDGSCGGFAPTAVFATIGGGSENYVGLVAHNATIAGGSRNYVRVTSEFATIGGGLSNRVNELYGTIPGGFDNAAGELACAMGAHAKANHKGSFVWGDSSSIDVASTASNQFTARASGGVRFFTDAGATTGAELLSGSGSWSSLSDRNAKTNFVQVKPREVLDRLARLPMNEWSYKAQDPSVRHIGPMAQDFHTAFGVGEDDRRISSVDADGVALAAIQGLHSMVQEKEKEIEALKQRLAAIEALLARGSR